MSSVPWQQVALAGLQPGACSHTGWKSSPSPHHKPLRPPRCPQRAGKLLFDSALTESSRVLLPNTEPAYKNMVLLRSNCFKRSNCITLGPFAAPLRQTLSTSSRNLPSTWIRSRCSASGKTAARPQIPGWDGRGVQQVPKPCCRLPAGARTTSRGFI